MRLPAWIIFRAYLKGGMMELKLDKQGLIPAIAQDANTGQVLMLGYMNPGSLKRTFEGAQVWFYSRSREDMWHKGEVSGNYLNLKEAWVDCDGDTLLLKVNPDGPACHTGETSCFFTKIEGSSDPTEFARTDPGSGVLDALFAVIQNRKRDMPEGSYTADLLKRGIGRVAQKVTEEAGETAIAAAMGKSDEIPGEVADLIYHTLVLLAATGIQPQQVWNELQRRHK